MCFVSVRCFVRVDPACCGITNRTSIKLCQSSKQSYIISWAQMLIPYCSAILLHCFWRCVDLLATNVWWSTCYKCVVIYLLQMCGDLHATNVWGSTCYKCVVIYLLQMCGNLHATNVWWSTCYKRLELKPTSPSAAWSVWLCKYSQACLKLQRLFTINDRSHSHTHTHTHTHTRTHTTHTHTHAYTHTKWLVKSTTDNYLARWSVHNSIMSITYTHRRRAIVKNSSARQNSLRRLCRLLQASRLKTTLRANPLGRWTRSTTTVQGSSLSWSESCLCAQSFA